MRRPPLAARVRRSLLPLLLCCCCLAAWSPPPAARALPLCTDGRAPLPLNRTLAFCSAYGGGSGNSSSCCDAAADAALRKRFDAMKVPDAACAGVVKSVLCANGRFFVSYNCDRTQSPKCAGRCSCNSAANCDPSKLGTDNGAQPCQYQVVVSEYSAKVSSSTVSMATSANPSEVRRIFTMGLPYTAHHGGQILFGPTDGYLYLMMGDGGSKGDPFNFSQNKKSLLGKIMRLDIDGTQSQSQTLNQSLWGNYSIPKDNPFADDSDLQPEIWALGFSNPWRCSFDSKRPSYFYCGDVGQDAYEEVDLITKGGNYGWRAYEGPYIYHPQQSPGGNTSLDSINAIFPVMGYDHSSVNKEIGSASITGGYVYRGSTDPCLYGRYLYTDLYSSMMWTGTETPEGSGNYTSAVIPLSCSKNSPIACESSTGSTDPLLGYIFSFGEDNSKDIFVLASKGVYRVVRPSLCGYTCAAEKPDTNNGTTTTPGSSSSAPATRLGKSVAVALALAVVLLRCPHGLFFGIVSFALSVQAALVTPLVL
ncbi:HIPL1 protein [Setaria italica]|uniref:HIPL1 protein n=1 Tax=Setaria italica TaxID=4555 RepID=UPI000350B7EE|nr:HIPL1 protein [Setaria italica]